MSTLLEATPMPAGVVAPPNLLAPPDAVPEVSNLITEDDTPVDSRYSEKLMRFLVAILYSSWADLHPNRKMAAMANVGLFYADRLPAVVPDVLLSLDVDEPADLHAKEHRSYFIWKFGKPPDLALEIVSNKEGKELDEKLVLYARIGIPYYVVWDPGHFLSLKDLHSFSLRDRQYQETGPWYPGIGLGIKEWRGQFETMTDTWLRWCDAAGNLLLTADEKAAKERQKAEAERERAEAERERADRLAAQLRALGVEPQ